MHRVSQVLVSGASRLCTVAVVDLLQGSDRSIECAQPGRFSVCVIFLP